VEIGRMNPTRREWLRRSFQEKTRVVCQSCNNGWMSKLEEAAQPVLTPAIQRSRCLLTADEQAVAAAWAFKTCLVFQASQAERPIAPPTHFYDLRRLGNPPRQVSIWISSHYRARQDALNSAYVQRPLSLEAQDGESASGKVVGYLCFLAVGGVSFLVVGHHYNGSAEVSLEGLITDALDQIWPDPSGALLWPPRLMMDADFVDTLTLPPGGLVIRSSPESGTPNRQAAG
jgi:hypothetical protein